MSIAPALFLDQDAACRVLAPARSDKTDKAGRYDLADLVSAGMPIRLRDGDGATVGGYVLEPFGRVLWITAAAGAAAVSLVPVIDDLVTLTAMRGGYQAVAFRTTRPGLIKWARRLGYEVVRQEGDETIMRKNIAP